MRQIISFILLVSFCSCAANQRDLAKPQVQVGSLVRVRLTHSASVPTNGGAVPVVLQFIGPLKDPDGVPAFEIQDARLVATATSSDDFSRVELQLISLLMKNGASPVEEQKVSGWVIGTDGLRGLPGTRAAPDEECFFPMLQSDGSIKLKMCDRSSSKSVIDLPAGLESTVVFSAPLVLE